MGYKQVIVIRSDLKMSRGKTAAQAAHASISAAEQVDKKVLDAWKKSGQKKIVLKVAGLEEMAKIKEVCEKAKIPSAIISDAGMTELEPGTITALGIGPEKEEKIDKVTGHLKIL
jgi:peptidyl-tRNA hydrolase, PTH2 family